MDVTKDVSEMANLLDKPDGVKFMPTWARRCWACEYDTLSEFAIRCKNCCTPE